MTQEYLVPRALSLTQPWATLVVIGAKRFETRDWGTSYRGWLGIHASKGFPVRCRKYCEIEPFRRRLQAAGYESWMDLPIGALIGAARLTEVLTAPRLDVVSPFGEEWEFGNYAEGRRMWRLEGARRARTIIPMKGALGLWMLPPIPVDLEAI